MDKNRLVEIEKNFHAAQEPVMKQHDEMVELLELAKLGLNPKLPTPTHFTIKEGGEWIGWYDRGFSNTNIAHAIKFDDGSIFDMVNGWRPRPAPQRIEENLKPQGFKCNACGVVIDDEMAYREHICNVNERRVPRYDGVGQELPSELPTFFNALSNDQRIVSRKLLEFCLEILERADKVYAHLWDTKDITDLRVVISCFKANLATEKKDLRAPVGTPVCNTWRSMSVNGPCMNCGNRKDQHKPFAA